MTKNFLPKYHADVKPSTYESHQRAFQRIINRFGDRLLDSITVLNCEEYRTWLINHYSQGYASMNYIAFRQVLEFAVKMGFLRSNVAKRTNAIPKGRSVQSYWTKEDFERVISQCCIDVFEQHMNFMLIWLYFMTGMRVGKGQALRWSDVNLSHGTIKIFHNIDYKNKHDYIINNYAKTASGMRMISIDRTTISYLKRWKKSQRNVIKSDFILSYDGDPVPRSTIQKIIERYAKLAGVPVIQAKGLRHSHVSYLINEFNAEVLTVSRRLGHSSPDITLRYYAHMWNRNDSILAEKMTNNINFTPAKEDKVSFNGNQFLKSMVN